MVAIAAHTSHTSSAMLAASAGTPPSLLRHSNPASAVPTGDARGAAPSVTSRRSNSGTEETAAVYSDPRVQDKQRLQKALAASELHQQTQEIQALAQRDREVRAHEQAHVAAGGPYAGAATYQLQRGPNGVGYAVAGEVPISTGREATPQATLQKAQVVKRAALAPAEPSAQDRQVAAAATRLEAEARLELAQEQQEQQRDAFMVKQPGATAAEANPGVTNPSRKTALYLDVETQQPQVQRHWQA